MTTTYGWNNQNILHYPELNETLLFEKWSCDDTLNYENDTFFMIKKFLN